MPFKRKDIEFQSESTRCAGWLYLPEGADASKPVPGIVMAHGIAAVKEMLDVPAFAEVFAEAGFAVLLFDYRFWGASDGEPRHQVFPASQIEDFRNAISELARHPAVDASRLGVWGTSFAGGHALHLGAFEPRIKCVVSQAPAVDLLRNMRLVSTPEAIEAMRAAFAEDRRRRYEGEPGAILPVVAANGEPCLLPGETNRLLRERELKHLPSLGNEITLASIEKLLEYAPSLISDRIAPVPLLMIVVEDDELTPSELALEAFERAGEPKQLLKLKGGHYVVYRSDSQKGFEEASRAATAWFTRHLGRHS